MIPCSNDFLATLNRPVKEMYVKFELYDNSMKFLSDITKDVTKEDTGSISVDKNRPVRRSFSFSLNNISNLYSWGEEKLIWINKRVKVLVGLKLPNGKVEYIPQGVFILTDLSDNHTKQGKTTSLSGQDKAYLFTDKRGKFINELTIAKDTKISTAIKTIAQAGGENLFLFDTVTKTVPYELTYSSNDNRWTAMEELAKLAQCDLYYDVNGYLRLEKVETNIDLEPTVWSYKNGESGDLFYAGNVRKLDEYEMANAIRVIGASAQSTTIIYDLVVDDTKTQWKNNPYSIQKIGYILYQHNDGNADSLITTQSDAIYRARYELMKRLGYCERLDLYLAPNWLHDAGDVVEVVDDNNVEGKYLIESFQVPIKPDLMTANCLKYRKLIENWDDI